MKAGLSQSHALPAFESEYVAPENGRRSGPTLTAEGVRHAASNMLLALLFFSALAPRASRFGSGVADDIWLVGAIVMGLLSLVRVPPRSVMRDWQALVSTGGALVLPALMRPALAAGGVLAAVGIAIELMGLILSQTARIYMGRRFGLLPANRGIVSSGPFGLVRHPVYLGWFMLSLGFALAYPSARNFICFGLTAPLMVWRIVLEESLLVQDREYRVYCDRVPCRLIPGII